MAKKPSAEQPARIERTLLRSRDAGHRPGGAEHRLLPRPRASSRPTPQLDADEQGLVRFHARPPKNGQALEVLDLECAAEDGATTHHKIALRADVRGAAGTAPAAHGTLRPALAGDPMALSDRELLARGYTPRPDPASSPARYARWHRRVSRPFTQVSPTKIAHPGVTFSRPQPRLHTQAQMHPALPPQLFSPTLPLPPPFARPMFIRTRTPGAAPISTVRPGSSSGSRRTGRCRASLTCRQPGLFRGGRMGRLDDGGTDLSPGPAPISECWFLLGWTFTNYWMSIETLPFDPVGAAQFSALPGNSVSVDIFTADRVFRTARPGSRTAPTAG